jgi:hypothetical protein
MLLISLACVATYYNTFPGEWVWDDVSSVLLHQHVRDTSKLFQLFREDQHAFGRGEGNFYRPLVSASFMIDYWLSSGPSLEEVETLKGPEVSTTIFHLTNLLLHLAAALLFALLLYRLSVPAFVCFAAPLIFVVHPLHTEAVAYISGRADMMSGIGILAALYFSVRATQSSSPLLSIIAGAACFVFGLLSKESSLIYPFLLVMLLLFLCTNRQSEKTPWSKITAPMAAAGAILVVYLILRSTVLRFVESTGTHASSLTQRLFEAFQSLGLYLKLLFVPTKLHMERVLVHVSQGYFWLGLAFLICLIGGIVLGWYWNQRRIAAGFAWFIITWLPISGIFPLNAPMAEHWMYMPMAGFWWALAELIFLLFKRPPMRQLAYAVVLILSIVFIVMSAQRNVDWHDNVSLFRATLRENPDSARVHFNLAVTYQDIEKNYVGARRHYKQYLRIQAAKHAKDPSGTGGITDADIEAQLSLGHVLMELREFEAAVQAYAPLITLGSAEAWRAVAAQAAAECGKAFLALGDVNQSAYYFQQALTLEPAIKPAVKNSLDGIPFNELY